MVVNSPDTIDKILGKTFGKELDSNEASMMMPQSDA